jgi:hypothetical protein
VIVNNPTISTKQTAIASLKSLNIKKTRQLLYYEEEFEDTKGVIRIRILKKNRQHNGQKTEEQTTQWSKEKVQKDK